MYACLAVTCHLHFWQNDRDFLRATAVTRGWNGYRNKSQHRKSTLEKKILPPFQQGFEPATFQSRVRCSNHWAIPAPRALVFAIMHLYTILKFYVCPFFFSFSFSLTWYQLIRRNGRRYQHVLALRALLTGVILKGQTLWKFVPEVCVYMYILCLWSDWFCRLTWQRVDYIYIYERRV